MNILSQTDAWLDRWRHANDELAISRERFREVVYRDNNGHSGLFVFGISSPSLGYIGLFGGTTLRMTIVHGLLVFTFYRADKQMTMISHADDITGKHLYVQYLDAELDEAKRMLEDVVSHWTSVEQMMPHNGVDTE